MVADGGGWSGEWGGEWSGDGCSVDVDELVHNVPFDPAAITLGYVAWAAVACRRLKPVMTANGATAVPAGGRLG